MKRSKRSLGGTLQARRAQDLLEHVDGGHESCVFCRRMSSKDVMTENELAVAFLDEYPVSPGHTLIVPRRHETDFFSLSEEERGAIFVLLAEVKDRIEKEYLPDGYNIGANVGTPAGQTVAHAHFHVIPRYAGDTADPRGGVRWVIPDRAPYWRA